MKCLKIKNNIKNTAKSNPRLAQIPTINPRYIWGCVVFITPPVDGEGSVTHLTQRVSAAVQNTVHE